VVALVVMHVVKTGSGNASGGNSDGGLTSSGGGFNKVDCV